MNVTSTSLRVSPEQLAWGIERLKEFVAIPSVSNTNSEHYSMDALCGAAQFAGSQLDKLGFEVRYVSIKEAQPYVIAKRVQDVSLPTMIVYAHYDKQPVEMDQWVTHPFKLEEKNGRLYGRGASDDGGGLAVILTALKVREEANEALPVNLIVFLEGEEEFDSPHMEEFLQQEHDSLASAQALVIMDGLNRDVNTGTLNNSTRGVGSIEVEISALDKPVHSGIGLLCPDPNMALSKLLVSLADPWQIPGFIDSSKLLSHEEIALLEKALLAMKNTVNKMVLLKVQSCEEIRENLSFNA